MDIKRWRVMLAVDDYGSFTRAGEILGYTQSGITQMMKSLEKEVGFSLFIKDKHGMRLTAEAKSLVPAVRRLLNADEVVRQEIASLKGAQVGVIKIGTYLSCSIHWIPGIIQKFHHTHPDIHFKIIEGSEGELADWIQERRVDIGFISRQEGHRYQFLPVMDDELFAVLPEGHPFAEYQAIPLEKFNSVPFVATEYAPGSDVHRILSQYQIKPDIRFHGRTRTWSHHSARSPSPRTDRPFCAPPRHARCQPPARTCLFLRQRAFPSLQELSGILQKFPAG